MPEGHVLRRFVLSTPLCLPHPVPSFDSLSLFLPFFLDVPVIFSHSLRSSSLLLSSSLVARRFSASSLQIYNAFACNKRLRASFTIMSSLQVRRGLIELRPVRSTRQECPRYFKMGLCKRKICFDLLMRFYISCVRGIPVPTLRRTATIFAL